TWTVQQTFGVDPAFAARTVTEPGAGGGNPALGSNWGHTANPWKAWKGPTGNVEMLGNVVMTGGSPAGVVATLPSGLRPTKARFFEAIVLNTGVHDRALLEIDLDGTVNFTRISGSNATGDTLMLDGLFYSTSL